MSDGTEPGSDVPKWPTHADSSPDRAIVLPAPSVWAIVRFASLPIEPPEELLPYAIRQAEGWVLTDDALAFGETQVVQRFSEWRATWDRTWTLDPLPNLRRLGRLVERLDPGDTDMSALLGHNASDVIASGGELALPPHQVLLISAALDRVAPLIRARDASGYGIVDRTPNADRVGLARSWPSCGGIEVIAQSPDLSVVLDPASGLYLENFCDSMDDRFGPIDTVDRIDAQWTVSDGKQTIGLSGEQGRPLAWLVPGATAWSVRRIPEVVSWAKTFAGLADAAEFAERTAAPVRLTTSRPVADNGTHLPST